MPRKTYDPATFVWSPPVCFNEAAARCRGKLGPPVVVWRRVDASMRPRPDAAENAWRNQCAPLFDLLLQ